MEEMTIWEQHTATLCKDPRKGFGIAISGGRDRAGGSVVVSDVVPGGPAVGRLQTGDHIVMVNGVSMETVTSSFAIHILKTCHRVADITVKRPRRIQLPSTKVSPSGPGTYAHRGTHDDDEADQGRGYEGDTSSGSGRSWDEHSRRSRAGHRSRGRRSPGGGSEANGLALVSGFKRLPRQDVQMRPLKSVLVRRRESEEFGVKLGSRIFIKHITDSGLAARSRGLQEGDLILQINGVSSENLSLGDTRRLIEKSEGKLTLLVLRDRGQFLVNIPPAVSDSESSLLDDISELGSELSQAPPSHVPPPPRHGHQSPDTSRSNSPEERRTYRRESSVDSRTASEPHSPRPSSYDIYRVPSGQSMEDRGYSPDSRLVRFVKGANIGLKLAGGNDVGIFVSGVQEGSPADGQGIQQGDEILQVNDTPFRNLTREEAVQFLLGLPAGEEVELVTQRKQDIFRKMVQSRVGDSFYVRTHFEQEPSPPYGLGFTRGDVFHVLDTLYPGPGHSQNRGGQWLAVRMGRDLQELERGIIPNQSRAEQLASLEAAQRAAGLVPGASSAGSSARAEFWRLRGLRRGAKRSNHHSREDLSALTKQGHYPPYERVVLREASFKRPVVILGPVTDVAMQKLTAEMPDQFEIAESMSRTESPSKIIKLDTVRVIAEKDKHALLDVTPSAVERLNYVQYYPIVVFCVPESQKALKTLRQWLAPASRRSTRRLYAQAQKLQRYSEHLFTASIRLQGLNYSWYEELKAVIREQQTRPIWTAEDQLDSTSEDNLDLPYRGRADSSADLSCDSRVNSDYETDGEGGVYTDGEGGVYTDGEGGLHTDVDDEPRAPALARSSEPVLADEPQSPPHHHQRSSENWGAQVEGRQPQGQWRQDSMRTYEREALKKKFTRARDLESSDEDGYDWGPATDL
ncbi:tight junction protein ZO-3 [Sorex araneus]|uniref:tight junction protein ZO-3 n=1 Tax=Sorex araneus TaxID=42254 RepID=UPI000331792B|nr:tight junction protein ZO-3 [Sorex araneus]